MTPTEMYAFLNRHFKEQVYLAKDPADTSLSVDDYIALTAKHKNLKLFGLETTEEQIEFINKDVEAIPRKNHRRRVSNIVDKIRI